MKRNDVMQPGSTTEPGPWDDGPVIPRIPRPRPPHPGSLAQGPGWQFTCPAAADRFPGMSA